MQGEWRRQASRMTASVLSAEYSMKALAWHLCVCVTKSTGLPLFDQKGKLVGRNGATQARRICVRDFSLECAPFSFLSLYFHFNRWPPALVTAAPVLTTVPPRAGSTLAKSSTFFHLRLCRHLRPTVVTSGHWKVGRTIGRLRLHRAITFRPLAASVTIVALVYTTPITNTTTAAAATRTRTHSNTNTVSLITYQIAIGRVL
jgi:hypothetical protein